MGTMHNAPIDTAIFNLFLKAVEKSLEPDKVAMVRSVAGCNIRVPQVAPVQTLLVQIKIYIITHFL
jgi:hypothetical protein